MVQETCACLFHSTPNHLTTPSSFSLYIPLQFRICQLQRRERRKKKLTIPCPAPAPRPEQSTGRQASDRTPESCEQQTGLSLESRKKKKIKGEVGESKGGHKKGRAPGEMEAENSQAEDLGAVWMRGDITDGIKLIGS